MTNALARDLSADEKDALRQFAKLGISVEEFLRRMSAHISIGSFVPGEREINIAPMALRDVTVKITRDDIRWVVQRYLHGKMSGEQLSNWAGLLLAISAYELPSDDDDDDVLELLNDVALPLKEQYLDRDRIKERPREHRVDRNGRVHV